MVLNRLGEEEQQRIRDDIAEQLDTGTVLALKGPADGWAFPQGSDGDYMALTKRALEADGG